MSRPSTKRRRMALLYIRTARQVLEEEDHEGPHPLEDAISRAKDLEKILDSALKPDQYPEPTEA